MWFISEFTWIHISFIDDLPYGRFSTGIANFENGIVWMVWMVYMEYRVNHWSHGACNGMNSIAQYQSIESSPAEAMYSKLNAYLSSKSFHLKNLFKSNERLSGVSGQGNMKAALRMKSPCHKSTIFRILFLSSSNCNLF